MSLLRPNEPRRMQSWLPLDSAQLASELKPLQMVIPDPVDNFLRVLMRYRCCIFLHLYMSPPRPKRMRLLTRSFRHTYASGLRFAVCLRNLKAAKPQKTWSFCGKGFDLNLRYLRYGFGGLERRTARKTGLGMQKGGKVEQHVTWTFALPGIYFTCRLGLTVP